MLLKLPKPRQANLILITKESMTKNLVNLINSLELMFFHLSKMRYDLFRDVKLRRPILSPVQPLMLTDIDNVMFLRKRKRRIYANTLKSV